MSDARSLTPLSEIDYDTIAAAVMETSRGRWFLSEYAKRNRHADTEMLLTAIGRLERAAGLAAEEARPVLRDVTPPAEPAIAATGIWPSSSVPARRLFEATAAILDSAERIQEAAWTLRESGADPGVCDTLDHRATEIYRACGELDAVSSEIEDRAAAEAESVPAILDDRPAGGIGSALDLADLDMIEVPFDAARDRDERDGPRHLAHRRFSGIVPAEDDVAFSEEAPALPHVSKGPKLSDDELRRIDAMLSEDKLHLFA